ncbi:MAG: GNAT family N-acetyltransferase [Streptosporangiaceae bacterium]
MITIERAGPADAGEILTVQRAAYLSEAQLYGDPFIQPLVESLDQLRNLLDGEVIILKATRGGRLVGSVRATVQEQTCLIGRLVVVPDLQGEGIGTRLMQAVEAEVAGLATALVLFTGHLSAGNLTLYRRLGYREYRRERVSDQLVLVHLRK